MNRFAWFPAIIFICIICGGGCNDQLKQTTKERNQLQESVQILNSKYAELGASYKTAKSEQVRLQEEVDSLREKQAAGECMLVGDPAWDFKDREFLASCRGRIKNSGSVAISNVSIMIILRDANKEILNMRYTNGQPTKKCILYVMVRERMTKGDEADFTLSIFTKYLQGDDIRKIRGAIDAGGARVEVKPMFIQ